MFTNLQNVVTIGAMVIASVTLVLLAIRGHERIVARHRKAAKDSVKASALGIPFLPEILDAYAFGDVKELAASVVDAIKVLHDETQRKPKFDEFLRKQLELSVSDPDRIQEIAKVVASAQPVLDALIAMGKVAAVTVVTAPAGPVATAAAVAAVA